MNRNNLISLIILDIIVMVLSIGLIYFRYSSLTSLSPNGPSQINLSSNIAEGEMSDSKNRNIRFTYRHSAAKRVEIIGEFNGWIPKLLTKGEKHTWKIDLSIEPGEYAYNFVVDGRPIRDPNNPNITNVGRGFENSKLIVKPVQ